MLPGGRRSTLLLFVGDVVAFALALYLTLFVRAGASPSPMLLARFAAPFILLFVLWALVFYGAGLYGKRLALFPSREPDLLIRTQVANIVLAALFFFFIPAFGIAPKTILALYLVVSLLLVYLWRVVLYPKLFARARRARAALIARGGEADELYHEVNGNPRYGVEFALRAGEAELADPAKLASALEEARVSVLVVDTALPDAQRVMPLVYQLVRQSQRYQLALFEDFYEEVFDRIPLSLLTHSWFLENVAPVNTAFYALAKRAIDLVGALLMGVVVVVLTPFVFVADKLEGPGPVFLAQERIGRRGTRVRAYKFRSMTKNLAASGEWTTEGDNRVTKVGAFLRQTSLDEFPQFVNVLAGDLSLIGPRNDIAGLGKRLAEALPYYEARYLVTPGITGWAQINQRYEPGNLSPQSIEETKVRLAYDFYYLKYRSLGLDLMIALKTVKRMFWRVSAW